MTKNDEFFEILQKLWNSRKYRRKEKKSKFLY